VHHEIVRWCVEVATIAADVPPQPGEHARFVRDYEYKSHATLSLLAGIDLLTSQAHLVKDRHRGREFIEYLQLLDAGVQPIPRSTSAIP
jgi:hypothetical protein